TNEAMMTNIIIPKFRYFFLTALATSILLLAGCTKNEPARVDEEPEPDTQLTFPEVEPNGVLNVLDCGVIADGTTDNTSLLQRAINECSAKSATLTFPKGTYFTKPLF